MSFTIRQIAKALNISKERVEQWISRKHFSPPSEPVAGKARDWDVADVMRLAIMRDLVEAGIATSEAGRLTSGPIFGFKDDIAFFVCWRGLSDPSEYLDRDSVSPPSAYFPDHWYEEVVRGTDLPAFLANPYIISSSVICLDVLEQRVKAALERSASQEE